MALKDSIGKTMVSKFSLKDLSDSIFSTYDVFPKIYRISSMVKCYKETQFGEKVLDVQNTNFIGATIFYSTKR